MHHGRRAGQSTEEASSTPRTTHQVSAAPTGGEDLAPSHPVWPLWLLLGVLWVVGVLFVLALVLLVHRAGLPGWLETILSTLLIGFLVPGAKATRRRWTRNPRAMKRPERG